MRLNEVIGLKWGDIDFSKGLISCVQSKTGKLVSIPLSSYLADELMQYKAGCNSGHLFEGRMIKKSLMTTYSNHFARLFKELGIFNFTFHNLRHTFASLQGDLGTGAVTVKDMLGHSDLSMTLRYSHAGLDGKKRAIEAFTNHILGMNESGFTTLKKAINPMVSKTGTT